MEGCCDRTAWKGDWAPILAQRLPADGAQGRRVSVHCQERNQSPETCSTPPGGPGRQNHKQEACIFFRHLLCTPPQEWMKMQAMVLGER